MDEWVVWFYVEPFILYLNRNRGQHLLSPLFRSLSRYPTQPVCDYTIKERFTARTYSDGEQTVAPDAEVEEQILIDVVEQRLVDFRNRLHQQLYRH